MYKVMIVEDEALVRLGLKNGVDWAKHRMEVVADLPNGKAAHDCYLDKRPDIIITDINMPVMSGLELIARIRETDSDTLFVILTCLEEFALLKQAMSLGVTDYLLKLTATEQTIDALLEKLKTTLESRGAGAAPGADTALASAKTRLIHNYIFYHTLGPGEFASQASRLQMNLSPKALELVLMEADDYPRLKETFEDEKGYLINFALTNVLTEMVGARGEVCHEGDARYLLLLNPGEEDTGALLARIARATAETFQGTVSFGAGRGAQDGFGRLGTMYDDANLALQNRYFRGRGTINRLDSPVTAVEVRAALQPLYGLYAVAGIRDSQLEQQYHADLDRRLAALLPEKEAVKETLSALMTRAVEQMNLKGDAVHGLLMSHGQALQQHNFLADDLEELRRFLLDVRGAPFGGGRRGEMAKALDYIHRNYHRDITLQEVAAHVNLSPNYFSSLFKREIGASLTETLNQLRIREARHLLRETDMKTYEIAEKVGFHENTYFSTLFKRTTGMSPNQYRDSWKPAQGEDTANDNGRRGMV